MIKISSVFKKSARSNGFLARGIASAIIEPPLDTNVTEKPFTLLLMEDRFIYKDTWKTAFENFIPRDYGMLFVSLSVPEESNFDDMVEELKSDLFPIHDAVLISRGPISSWCAQFYLESRPLKGLVMVDPILFDQQEDLATIDAISVLQMNVKTAAKTPMDFGDWMKVVAGAQQRKLKLEPNSVPMFIFTSRADLKICSNHVAKRHSDMDGPFGEVLLKEISQDSQDENKHTHIILNELDRWIDKTIH